MNNDKVFALYACTLIAGIGSVITATVLAGVTTMPSPLVFLEHLAMSFTFRAAYHSFAGPVWWPYPQHEGVAEGVPAVAAVAEMRDAA
jgi:hypothetical protein